MHPYGRRRVGTKVRAGTSAQVEEFVCAFTFIEFQMYKLNRNGFDKGSLFSEYPILTLSSEDFINEDPKHRNIFDRQ